MSNILEDLKNKFPSFFKRITRPHPHDRIDSLNKTVQQSFQNLRRDMEHVSKLLHYYDGKHKGHDRQIQFLVKRINYLEVALRDLAEEQPQAKQEVQRIIQVEKAQEERMLEEGLQFPRGTPFRWLE